MTGGYRIDDAKHFKHVQTITPLGRRSNIVSPLLHVVLPHSEPLLLAPPGRLARHQVVVPRQRLSGSGETLG